MNLWLAMRRGREIFGVAAAEEQEDWHSCSRGEGPRGRREDYRINLGRPRFEKVKSLWRVAAEEFVGVPE